MNKIYLTLGKTIPLLSTFFAVSMLISPVANAGLVFFNDRAAFELASGLSGITEDFESANLGDWEIADIGEIASGLNVSASYGDVVALSSDYYGSQTVGATEFNASTILSFDAGVQAIGLDLFSFEISDIFDISIFGVGDSELDSTVSTSTTYLDYFWSSSFFGVISDDALITKIDFSSPLEHGIDNITYGNVVGVVDVPEPSSVFLLLSAMIAFGMSRKKV
ncbi:MAG: PEP-CTERM sorting domain-containing protein [Colwellia sp.]|nr:PEP-CTERM sorting domain-containing protein [Colwellia sp.]